MRRRLTGASPVRFPAYWRVTCSVSRRVLQIPRDGRWTFNGDFQKPTIRPSLNETSGFAGETHAQLRAGRVGWRNHVWITDGKIEYLSDCTHELRGQTVDIEPLTEAEIGIYLGDEALDKWRRACQKMEHDKEHS